MGISFRDLAVFFSLLLVVEQAIALRCQSAAEAVEHPYEPYAWGDHNFRTLADTIRQPPPDQPSDCTDPRQCDNIWEHSEEDEILESRRDQVITHLLFHARSRNVLGKYRDIAPKEDNRIPLIVIHGWEREEIDPLTRSPCLFPDNVTSYANVRAKNVHEHHWHLISDGSDAYFGNLARFLETPSIVSRFRVYYYSYPSYKRITYNARILSNLLSENEYIQQWLKGGGKLVFLAHSMGGLVARSLLEEHDGIWTADANRLGTGRQILGGLITLGTPHHGSPLALPTWGGMGADVATLGRDQPGSQDLYWDNYDGMIFFKPVLKDIAGVFSGYIQRDDIECTYADERRWYNDNMRMEDTKALDGIYRSKLRTSDFVGGCDGDCEFCFREPGIFPKDEKLVLPAATNPWLSTLSNPERLIDGNGQSELFNYYYFYAGANYNGGDKYDGDASKEAGRDTLEDNDVGWSPYTWINCETFSDRSLYAQGYISDCVVPLSSALLDRSYLSPPFNVSTILHGPDDKLIGHTGTTPTLQEQLDNLTVRVWRWESQGLTLRWFRDYDHARIKDGAFLSVPTDLQKPHGVAFRDTDSHRPIIRNDYIAQAFGEQASLLPEAMYEVSEGEGDDAVIPASILFEPVFISIGRDLLAASCEANPKGCSYSFSDVRITDWFHDYVELLAHWGALTLDGRFDPGQLVTRAEFLKMALISFGLAIPQEPLALDAPRRQDNGDLLDLKPADWYTPFFVVARNITRPVNAYVSEPLIQGIHTSTGRRYLPNQSITRAEAAKIVLMLAGYQQGSPFDQDVVDKWGKVVDLHFGHWFAPWLKPSFEHQVLEGRDIGGGLRRLDLDQPVLRSEAAKMMGRAICNKIGSGEEEREIQGQRVKPTFDRIEWARWDTFTWQQCRELLAP